MRASRADQTGGAPERVPVVGDVLDDVQRDNRGIGALGGGLQVEFGDPDARVTGESFLQPADAFGVEVADRDLGETRAEPEGSTHTDAAANLDGVIAEVGQCQVGDPRVVPIGAFKGLEDAELELGLIGFRHGSESMSEISSGGRRDPHARGKACRDRVGDAVA